MHKIVLNLNFQYGVALISAPLLCFLYSVLTREKSADIFWLFFDLKSFFFLIIFYPIVEELAFRGVIQDYIYKKINFRSTFFSLTSANIITSILFVLMHFIHHHPIWALLTFIPSLLFGYFKDQYGQIIPSILLHMFYNLSYFSIVVTNY